MADAWKAFAQYKAEVIDTGKKNGADGFYLINSPMEPGLVRDADGGVTLYIQRDSPGKDKEANWAPTLN